MLSNKFYVKLRALNRFSKNVVQLISILTFKTNDKNIIVKLCSKALLVIFISVLGLIILTNLPVYLLQILPTNNVAMSFTSTYLNIYEFVVFNLNFLGLFGPINRFTIYFYVFFIIFIWKLFNIGLLISYEVTMFRDKNINQTFSDFKSTHVLNSYSDKKVNYNFTKKSKIYKNSYLSVRFLILMMNNLRLAFNYFLILVKKIKLHFFKYVLFNFIAFLKSYANHILPNKIVLWRPIFKRLSYFGLFRAYRSKWLNKN